MQVEFKKKHVLLNFYDAYEYRERRELYYEVVLDQRQRR